MEDKDAVAKIHVQCMRLVDSVFNKTKFGNKLICCCLIVSKSAYSDAKYKQNLDSSKSFTVSSLIIEIPNLITPTFIQ